MALCENFIGCCCPLHRLRAMGDELGDKVVDKINDTLELMMVNDFTREINEYQFKRCLQDRMADISSWRWVLEDLSKRLEESKETLNYELKACRVVVKRVMEEIQDHSELASKPGALNPQTDCVEDAIKEEYTFLRQQKKIFEELSIVLEEQISNLERTLNKIKNDILKKDETLEIEKTMAGINLKSLSKTDIKTAQKKKSLSLEHWEKKCLVLKQDGLQILRDSLLTKQQVRGARVQLTIAAQSLASKVDAAIRKRLHANTTKFEELKWQIQEASKDLKSLEDEQMNTEHSLLLNMEQQRVVEARLADRSYRPGEELTRDEVDQTLRAEISRIKNFVADLRRNLKEISHLQEYLRATITKMECYSEDVTKIIHLDEERTLGRLGELAPKDGMVGSIANITLSEIPQEQSVNGVTNLNTIKEEDENEEEQVEEHEEEDDYPFDE